MATVQDNKSLVARMVETFNARDIDAHMQLYADEINNHGFTVRREDIEYVLGDIITTSPDVTFETTRIIAEGEWVTLFARFRGTHLGVQRIPVNGGMLVGMPPTGKSFEVDHVHLYRVQNGLITEHHACRDDIEMMRQLGVIPPLQKP